MENIAEYDDSIVRFAGQCRQANIGQLCKYGKQLIKNKRSDKLSMLQNYILRRFLEALIEFDGQKFARFSLVISEFEHSLALSQLNDDDIEGIDAFMAKLELLRETSHILKDFVPPSKVFNEIKESPASIDLLELLGKTKSAIRIEEIAAKLNRPFSQVLDRLCSLEDKGLVKIETLHEPEYVYLTSAGNRLMQEYKLWKAPSSEQPSTPFQQRMSAGDSRDRTFQILIQYMPQMPSQYDSNSLQLLQRALVNIWKQINTMHLNGNRDVYHNLKRMVEFLSKHVGSPIVKEAYQDISDAVNRFVAFCKNGDFNSANDVLADLVNRISTMEKAVWWRPDIDFTNAPPYASLREF